MHLPALAGPFAPAAGEPNSIAVPMPTDPNDDSVFAGWATGVSVQRGLVRINNPSLGRVSHGMPQDALGPAQGQSIEGVVSLGDGGVAVVTFANPITDGPGYDFAVFENGFVVIAPNKLFLELAFVEVSSDGVHYERFPAVSLSQTQTQLANLNSIDATDIHNFAGKYPMGYGTPFDLADVRDVNDLVDVTAITHVRLVDVVGCLQDLYARYDSTGNKVNEPWPTDFSTGGFDLDAVGVMHEKTLAADMDGSGVVNLADFAVFSGVYLSSPNLPQWNVQCELAATANNVIDADDLLVFCEQWLMTERWFEP